VLVLLDLKSPESIAAWVLTWPERHRVQLRCMWRLCPDFRESIEAGAALAASRTAQEAAQSPPKGMDDEDDR